MRTSSQPLSGIFVFARWLVIVFLVTARAIVSPAQTLTTLVNFNGSNGNTPYLMALIQGSDGNVYGTTQYGGTSNRGVVFKMTPGGVVTVLYSFSNGSDGEYPAAGLVQGADGNFYGTTRTGGANNGAGTVFKISPTGTFTTLHSFKAQSEGGGLYDALVEGTDGNFYGTTDLDGPNSGGTIFKITPSGTVTVLYALCSQNNGLNCTDGTASQTGLTLGRDGNFYGVTTGGGAFGHGTVFKITPSGTFTSLHSFDGADDGLSPTGKLVQANDGNFYGTTYLGGAESTGTIFKITPSGTFTLLFTFCSNQDCSGGAEPIAGMIQAGDGNFYGATAAGGYGHGVVFRMTPSGAVTGLYAFCPKGNCPDGADPLGALVQANTGNFYGVTEGGGSQEDGTVFSLTGPPLIATITALTSAPNPSQLNQTVTMTATVHAQNGSMPVGNVLFSSDGVQIGTVAVNNSGVAVLNYSGLPLGTHSLVAAYQGGNGYAGSTSNTVQQVVDLPSSTTAVTSSPNPSTFDQQVTITATVGPSGPPQPTGTVSFTSNGVAISGCTGVPLNSGMASCSTANLAQGTDAIVATYSADSNYQGSSGMLSQIVNPIPMAIQFVPVTPCRIVDTRGSDGTFGGPAISGNGSRNFPLSQSGNPCSIPSTAVAYSLNVTVVPITTLGYLTIWPTGEGQPLASTLNSPNGRIKANAAIVPAGTPSGSVSVYVSDTSNVILDIDGYFAAPTSGSLQFYPLTPCRIVDTRNGQDQGSLQAGIERDYTIPGNCKVPSNAAAYSFNVTVLPAAGGLDYLTVWPTGKKQPVVSTLNDDPGTIVANAAIVPAGSEHATAFYAHSNNTDLLLDIDGYFAAPGSGGLSFYPLTPCRVLDTRQNGGKGFIDMIVVNVEGSVCGPPASAEGYVLNATVVPPAPMLYLTLWPHGEMQPTVSTLNAEDGFITSNMAIVPTNDGEINAYAYALTQLILDISGYFAP